MKILFITTDWNTPYRQTTNEYGGIGYYRAYMPAEALRDLGHDVDVLGADIRPHIDPNNLFGSYMKLFRPYEAIVFKQIDHKNAGIVLGAAKELKIPIAMDLDDNILEIGESNQAYHRGYKKEGVKRAFAAASLSMCDALFVTTEPLKKSYQKFLKDVLKKDMPTYILPNCCVPKHWNVETQVTKNMIIIGWHGSITHDEDLKLVMPVINKLMKKYPNLYFQAMGGLLEDSAQKLFSVFDKEHHERLSVIKGTPSWKGFPEYLQSLSWDIGIAPLVDEEFTRGKSHIKWLEFSLKKIPCVASRVYPYCEPIQGVETIKDGETGFLASTPEEWEEKLSKLIESNDLRRSMAKKARDFVMANWRYKHHAVKWESALKKLIEMGGE
uniref:Glycosyl transferase n=1 Tax=uncultured marine virus TaxID=186617 RepID=A0A0F7L8V0_9VIRU|nr:glycosyl transferase [uncultured marine virus]